MSPPPIDFTFEATPAERALFEKGAKEAIFNPMWAIVNSWILAYRAGHWYGVPLESEQEVVVAGVRYREQAYTAALARWNETTGIVTWAKP